MKAIVPCKHLQIQFFGTKGFFDSRGGMLDRYKYVNNNCQLVTMRRLYPVHAVIIGLGVTGATAAIKLREISPDAKISVFTDEKYQHYLRPRLYEVVAGEKRPEEIYSYPAGFFEKRNISIDFRRRAVELDLAKKQVLLAGGSQVNYDKLLLANGARAFLPPINGVEKKGVFTLRTIEDALAIREYSKKVKKVIVAGGGLLGLEFAVCARKLGKAVDVLEIRPRLLSRQLDEDGATMLKSKLEDLGIKTSLGVKVNEILGHDQVNGVALSNGEELQGGLLLIAAGIRSNTALATEAGIKVDHGVKADEHLQTSANDVYAAGDVAEVNGIVYGIIHPSVEQAKIASTNMVNGDMSAYKGEHYSATLKVAEISITSMGLVNPEGPPYEEIKKVNTQRGVYKKIVLDDGKIVGAIILGERTGIESVRKLMDRSIDITRYKDSVLEDNFDFQKILS
jgi:nitrite reductase (NADH) large subunit